MTLAKRIINLLLIIFLTLTLTACPDLGEYEIDTNVNMDEDNFEDYYCGYYDSWGDVKLYDKLASSNTYSLKDSFFNYDTVQSLSWKEESNAVKSDDYMILAVEAKRDMNVDCVSLYLKAKSSEEKKNKEQDEKEQTTEKRIDINIGMVVVNSIFSSIPKYTDSFDSSKDYDFPKFIECVGSAKLSVTENSWDSFTIETFNKEDNISISSGSYIVLIFYNNTLFGKNEKTPLEKVELQMLNLLIRVE